MCKHKWQVNGWTRKTVLQKCILCNETKERKATKKEQVRIQKHSKDTMEEGARLHAIWHEFRAKFIDENDGIFFQTGYQLMNSVKEWAHKHESVEICSCDDNYHMGSYLVLIPHETENRYWGTTIVYIPQGSRPAIFFFYHNELDGLINRLTDIQTRQKNKGYKNHIQNPFA